MLLVALAGANLNTNNGYKKNYQLIASFVYNRVSYHYSAAVSEERNKIKLKGEWNTSAPREPWI